MKRKGCADGDDDVVVTDDAGFTRILQQHTHILPIIIRHLSVMDYIILYATLSVLIRRKDVYPTVPQLARTRLAAAFDVRFEPAVAEGLKQRLFGDKTVGFGGDLVHCVLWGIPIIECNVDVYETNHSEEDALETLTKEERGVPAYYPFRVHCSLPALVLRVRF